MTPLNKQERSTAFWKFFAIILLMFIVAGALFYIVADVPSAQLNALKMQNEMLQEQVPKTDGLIAVLDSMQSDIVIYKNDTSVGIQQNMEKDRLNAEVGRLRSFSNDSSDFGKIVNKYVFAYIKWIEDIDRSKLSASGAQRIDELRRQLDDCTRSKNDYMQQLQLNVMQNKNK